MSLQANVSPKTISSLKSSMLLKPAQTTHFAVKIQPPSKDNSFQNFISATGRFSGFNLSKLDEICLMCSDATLPGSSLFTHEATNDYPGVTEKMVYRRQYDDYSSFTFYVDYNYEVIEFLESWLNFIVGEDPRNKFENYSASHRMKFREDYAGSIAITKFERSMGNVVINSQNTQQTPSISGPRMNYQFITAFPISIDSMPVSYENSTILKCNVNFTYLRYVRERFTK
jgi:hypothetical protein